jgi:hypothetical protein
MGDNQKGFSNMSADELYKDGERARCDGEATFASLRGEGVGIFVPRGVFVRESLLHFLPRQLLPPAMGDFQESRAWLNGEAMGLGNDAGGLHRAT